MNKSLKQKYINIWIPTFITSVIGFLYNITDSYLVSTISEDAVSAIGLMIPLVLIAEIMFYAISGSFARNIGQAYGANRMNRIKKKILVGIYVSLFLSSVLFLIMFLFQDYAYSIFGSGDNIKHHFEDYYKIWIFSILIIGVNKIYSSALSAISEVKLITIVSVLSVFVNTFFSYILINGYLGLPVLGMQGAALGTLITLIFSTLIYFYILNKKNYIIFELKKEKILVFFLRVKSYIYANIIGGMTLPLGLTFLTVLVSHYKDYEIASFTLAHRFDLLWFMVTGAFSSAFFILGNQFIGSKDMEGLGKLYKFNILVGTFLAVIILIISFLFGEEIGSLFLSSSKTIDNFESSLPYIVIIYIFWNTIALSAGLLNMLGKPYYSSSIGIVRVLSMYIIFPVIGSYLYGYQGILYGYAIGIIPPFIYVIYLMKTKQKDIKKDIFLKF